MRWLNWLVWVTPSQVLILRQSLAPRLHALINLTPDTFTLIGLFHMVTHSDRIRKQTTQHPHYHIKHLYKSHRSWCQLISHIENVFSVRYCFYVSSICLCFCFALFISVCGCCRCVWKIHPQSLSNTRLACLECLPIFSPSLRDPQSPFLQSMLFPIELNLYVQEKWLSGYSEHSSFCTSG